MANKEQLAILKQGVDVWNKWREDNPKEHIELNGTDLPRLNLQGADLRGANFRRTDLSETDFRKANLSRANLSRANLMGAKLNKADLIKAYLKRANFTGADLTGTYLKDADLSDADLSGANLSNANLTEANLTEANFFGANLTGALLNEANFHGANLTEANLTDAFLISANLYKANLSEANLTEASLYRAYLNQADLSKVDLRDANLSHSSLSRVDLSRANLKGATLNEANLIETDLTNAILTDCRIYGVSAWNLKLEGAEQSNLVITRDGEPMVTVDNLEVAQFVYLLLTNEKIRDVLDTIGKKGVLILGRFTPERKEVLNTLRDKLRKLDFVPMMFDFEGATTKDFTETVKILAGMSRFIIADITDSKSVPLELQAIVPDFKVPFVPIIQQGGKPFSMFANLQQYPWMFDLLEYKDSEQLITVIERARIQPALIKADELNAQKAESVRKEHAKDYL